MTVHSEFADNPEPRCACLLLLDTSGSMSGQSINELNAALVTFSQELSNDELVLKRVDVAVVTFGGTVEVVTPFTSAGAFSAPNLIADGGTPMGEAIACGLELLRQRKDEYRANGITPYRPWVFLITDGEPTDSITQARQLIHAGERDKGFSFYGVGVQDANMQKLVDLSPPNRPPVKLVGLKFREMFVWLSASLRSVSQSQPSEKIKLTDPAVGRGGWCEADLLTHCSSHHDNGTGKGQRAGSGRKTAARACVAGWQPGVGRNNRRAPPVPPAP
jgi:uncharacterized protein YegL